ncbi:unnamed protein product [Echinostoma caproni]|uniref:Arrestin_N domain-containing protein n=1 Tax=Echinostoma caproni TaxID=27848 RepID=A0A183ANA4_9TREM|nr:unnamed protein product [Echinostoma caproni]
MTSIDLLLNSCRRVPNPRLETSNEAADGGTADRRQSYGQSGNSTYRANNTACHLLIETSVGALPVSMALRCNLSTNLADGNVVNRTTNKSKLASSVGALPSHAPISVMCKLIPWTEDQRYRFESLQTPDVPHYLYLRNPYETASLEVIISFSPNFDCNPEDELTDADRSDHHSPVHERVQQLHASKNDTGTNDSISTAAADWSVSLLPWLNASWPELTPERGRRRPMRRNLADHSPPSCSGSLVNPRNPAHQLLDQCTLWSAPSRVSMPQAFASHFTYQPNSGRYSSGFQLQAWQVAVVPVEIDSRLDSGGTLEISLQLNAFAVTRLVNSTHSQPLLRQVILHGCFARHVTSTPFGFVDPIRCPLWLRLATDRGLAISVAHALSIAASNVLSRSQPPHRSEVPPTLDTSFDDTVDRSFLYLPYPTPGQWYLSLYAECYPVDDLCWHLIITYGLILPSCFSSLSSQVSNALSK